MIPLTKIKQFKNHKNIIKKMPYPLIKKINCLETEKKETDEKTKVNSNFKSKFQNQKLLLHFDKWFN